MSERREWSIAVHGGSGSMPKERLAGREQAFHDALGRAVTLGAEMLARRRDAASTPSKRWCGCSRTIRSSTPARARCSPTRERSSSTPRSWTGGRSRAARWPAMRTVKNPITLARRVMERTPHVFLAGDGAEAFAREAGVEIVDPSYFRTAGALGRAAARAAPRKRQRRGAADPRDGHGGSGGARSRRATSPPRPRPAAAPTSGSGASATCR